MSLHQQSLLGGQGPYGPHGTAYWQGQQAMNPGHNHMSNTMAQALSQLNYPNKYMINGVFYSFEDFVNIIFPFDCPEKTMFLLKHKEQE